MSSEWIQILRDGLSRNENARQFDIGAKQDVERLALAREAERRLRAQTRR